MKRKLQLPDGGTLDLPISEEFAGPPVFALEDHDHLGWSSNNISPKRLTFMILGAIGGAFAIWLVTRR